MQRIAAIAWLTVKAALRFRLVLVLAVLLIGSVVALPLVIKDDGTARGFTQIILTYTLSTITGLLGFSTLWLACGTLARDIEEAQIQVVAVKPIARWQIWLGKWLGIVALNGVLLAVSTGAVFALMQWRAQRLPPEQQTILRNEVMVARGSVREELPDFEPMVEQELRRRIEASKTPLTDLEYMRKQISEQIKAVHQVIRPGYGRQWAFELGKDLEALRDQPFFIRTRFNVAQVGSTQNYLGIWEVGDPATGRPVYETNMTMAAETFYEIPIPPNLFNNDGVLLVRFLNQNETALLFTVEDGIEVLYRQSGFGINFVRGVIILFLWLGLLAALGLAASTFLSFPVAAFVSLAVLIVCFSSGIIALVLEQGTVFEVNHDTGVADEKRTLDYVALPVFKVMLAVINMVRGFSPIDSLSTGRSITWEQIGLAVAQIGVIASGILALIGISVFSRRELAAAQSNH